jgi:zinc protease
MKSTLHISTLANGLQVILKEIHTAPLVSSWLWYRVGSRNEVEGTTGMSHWVEHMLFKGSRRFPKGSIMRLVDRFGGEVNAMTSRDYTAYYETLPSDQVGLALEIESDRMDSAAFDPAETEAERTVIIAEREGGENEPSFMLREALTAASFQVHPYHHQVVGWKSDLEVITRDELYAHYRRYYRPNNAVLVIAGDIQSELLMAQVERAFGEKEAGELPAAIRRPEPVQRGERRVTVRLPGAAQMVQIVYHAPPVADPDYLPLVILTGILSGGSAPFNGRGSLARSARLYRALVDKQLASSAGSSYQVSLDPFLFSLGAVVRQGRTAVEVEAALLDQVSILQSELVSSAEMMTAIKQTQAQLAYANESVASQALALGILSIVDNPNRLEGFLDELAAVTPADVLRVAQTFLTADNRTIGLFEPIQGGAA